jgi:hypothetical protein
MFLLALLLACIASIKGDEERRLQQGAVYDWFEDDFDRRCTESVREKNLHLCSRYTYLNAQQFEQMAFGALDKLDPPVKDHESVFELGMGVGAVLKVVLKKFPHLHIGGSDFSPKSIKLAKQLLPEYASQIFVQNMIHSHSSTPSVLVRWQCI